MTTIQERVRVPKTAEVVAQSLRSQIVRGEIPVGGTLPSESELMVQFGISRPSLREAFRILEAEQLIEVRRGSRGGARAMRPDVSVVARYMGLLMQFDGVLLSDVFQARALIEPLALRLLAQQKNRATASKQLLDILHGLREATEAERVDIWLTFFTELFSAAGNKTLSLLYGTLTEVIRQELADAMSDAVSDAENGIKAVTKALQMVVDGRGDEASEYWMRQMFMLEANIARLHRRKTLVDAVTQSR